MRVECARTTVPHECGLIVIVRYMRANIVFIGAGRRGFAVLNAVVGVAIRAVFGKNPGL